MEVCRSEKRYFRDASPENGRSWKAAIETFDGCLDASSCHDETRRRLRKKLADYEKLHQQYVEAAASSKGNQAKPEETAAEAARLATLGAGLGKLIDRIEREINSANVPQAGKILLTL